MTVEIALLSYNRPQYIGSIIDSILAQTHRDWVLKIYDNASTDPELLAILHRYAASDPRIELAIRPENIGAFSNFRESLRDAKEEFFIWAADDDTWFPDRLEKSLAHMENADVVMGETLEINYSGTLKFHDQKTSRHSSTGNVTRDVIRFIREPESLGKYNMIYSLYRTATVQKLADRFWDIANSGVWGADVVWNLAMVGHLRVVGYDSPMYHNMLRTFDDAPKALKDPRIHYVPGREVADYVRRMVGVLPPEVDAGVVRAELRKRHIMKYWAKALLPFRRRDYPWQSVYYASAS